MFDSIHTSVRGFDDFIKNHEGRLGWIEVGKRLSFDGIHAGPKTTHL